MNFIFHVGHCGSTLVSRLLGEAEGLFSLREPPPLRTLAWQSRLTGTRHAALASDEWQSLLATVMTLLGRTYRPGDTALVKATSYCSRIMEPLLGWHEESRAILLHIGLERYLNAMLRDEYHTEINRFVTEFYSADVKRLFRDQCPPVASLSIGQRAALILLAHRFEFENLARHPAFSHHLLYVDFDDFLANPVDGLATMSDFLGRPLGIDRCRDIIERSGHMTRHAKVPDLAYSSKVREQELSETRARRADDIADGLCWAEEMTALVSAAC